MKFIKDILLFDVETTGTDPEKDSILQLSAIVLDKDNLLEKDVFNAYVRISLLDNTLKEHADILQIPFETLKKSQKIYEVTKIFAAKFSENYLLATHTGLPTLFLRQAFRKSALPYPFDYHFIDLWTLSYMYTMHLGLKKMPTLQTLMDQYNLKLQNKRSALEKCRVAAEIFRRIVPNA